MFTSLDAWFFHQYWNSALYLAGWQPSVLKSAPAPWGSLLPLLGSFCQNNVSCLCYDFPGMYPWNTSNGSKHICGSVRIHMDSCSHHALIHFAIENKGPQRLGSTEVWILDAWWGKNSFVRCGMVIKFTPFSIQLRPLYSRIATSKA